MGCFHFQSNELSVAVFLISHQITLLPKWKRQSPRRSTRSCPRATSGKGLAVISNGKTLTEVPRWQLHCLKIQKENWKFKMANLGDFWKGLAWTYEMHKTILVVPQ